MESGDQNLNPSINICQNDYYEKYEPIWKDLYHIIKGDYDRAAYVMVLVFSSILLFAIVAFFGSYKRRSRNKLLKGALWAAYFLPFYVISNTLGLMQSPPYHNQMYAIWAVLFLLVHGCTNTTIYSIQDNQQGKRGALQEIILLYLAFWLYYLHHNERVFECPLLVILVVTAIKFAARMIIVNSRYSPSLELKRTTKLLSDYYMRCDKDNNSAADSVHMKGCDEDNSSEADSVYMKGCKYLVMGEEKMEMANKGKWDKDRIVTVEKIWDCRQMPLLSERGDRDGHLKDMCLSFALFKMLVLRFRRYPLHESHLPKTWNFVRYGLLSKNDHERAFRVIEVELSFLYDYFYSVLPVIFNDRRSFFTKTVLYVISKILVLGASIWIAIPLISYAPPAREFLDLKYCKINVDLKNDCYMRGEKWADKFCKKFLVYPPTHADVLGTCVVIGMFLVMQILQFLSVVFSNWTKVWLVCQYVRKCFLQKSKLWEGVLVFFCHPPLMRSKHWRNKMSQYFLLSSFNYRPTRCCFLCHVFIDKRRRGQKASDSVELSTHVKKAVIDTLIVNGRRLTNGVSSLRKNEVEAKLSWACSFDSNTYTIFVWHVATSFCVMEHDAECKKKEKDSGKVERDRAVATSISGYCAYLVAFAPSLLPDHPDDTELLFDATISDTRKLLKKCRKGLYQKLKDMENGESIVEMGVKLGKQLLSLPDEGQKWKVLAEFWAEMILFLAPSDNEMAHAESLANGGEFITHLWALLTHAGILKRNSDQLDVENPPGASSSQ
ncbi:uncharacterized protein LOC131221420 [Magnolia sinica]|uniref:uncharacterized protein LOC131221420 n=1 Tax=Magnolia sinica TaxID=86752 RepID=UPI00265872E3|nr:uncharacterized protein LOC131221420 [Magnolia sinica]